MQNLNFKNSTKNIKLGVAGLAVATTFIIPAVVNADSYTVQSGDTLSAIATAHNKTVADLVTLNNITNPNLISVGQNIEIDGGAATTTSTETPAEPAKTTGNATVVYSSNLNASDAAAKEEIAQRESSGSYTAQNGQYYGRYQLTLSYLNGDLSTENQEKVANDYVTNRYGSWSAALSFWNANGWY